MFGVQIIIVVVMLVVSVVLKYPVLLINVILLALTMTDVARRVYTIFHLSAVVVEIYDGSSPRRGSIR